jgi:hypothetical protein
MVQPSFSSVETSALTSVFFPNVRVGKYPQQSNMSFPKLAPFQAMSLNRS